ncbi:GAF domain-containing protein [Patescibacteria group bacterium]|nr:GAF domain-containing protein [Patescibacteria group bacterium]MBU4511716.1 GAF domain-containing protein [Patescibacteria group bacterium]MCG2692949.1 ATP-binding protein [Candidatus Parcubacteria bacterium]
MSIFYFNPYAIPLLIAALFLLFLAIFVLIRNTRSETNISYFFMNISAFVWQIGYFFVYISSDREVADFWQRIVYVGVPFLAPTMYHFSITFLKTKRGRSLIIPYYIFAAIFSFLCIATDLLLVDVRRYFWGYYTYVNKDLYSIFLAIWMIAVVYAIANLYWGFRKGKAGSSLERQQRKYISIAFLIVFLAALDFVPVYGIEIYPWGYLPVITCLSLIAYAIVKYRLMDVRLLVVRSITYSLLILYVGGVYGFLMYTLGQVLVERLGISSAFVPLIFAFIVVLGLDPIKKILAKYTDKLFYKDRIDYQEVLKHLSEVVAREIELEELLDSVLQVLNQELKIKNGLVLVADKNGKFFKPESYLNGRTNVVLDNKNHLIKYLREKSKIIVTEELVRMAADAASQEKKNKLERVRKELDNLDCALCVPVLMEGGLIAVIAIGPKMSGDMFSSADIQLFEVLGQQMAAALEKAKLYEEVQDFTKTLQQKVDQQTKELKQANVHLQQLDEAKSEFLSIAAHQLRTPLTALKGYLSMMIEGDYGKLDPKQEEITGRVLASSERLNRLVNQFLDVSRIEAGRLRLDKRTAQLEDVAGKVVENFQNEARGKGLKLEFVKPKKATSDLRIDIDKLIDVMSNLVDNSLKYTAQGQVIVRVHEKAGQVFFSVTDSGIGINKGDIPALFSKFKRTHEGERVYTSGSGLGLFIAKKMIEAHGGKVWAESEGKAKGSRFVFSLPVG